MRTAIFILIVIVLVLVFVILNQEFQWFDIGFREIAIGTAGGLGPAEFIRSKLNSSSVEKINAEQQRSFRTLERREFDRRNRKNQRSWKERQKDLSGFKQENFDIAEAKG